MGNFIDPTIVPIILINCILALSQAIPLRAGSFSLAPAGLAAIGAYGSAVLVVDHGWSIWTAGAVAILACAVLSFALAASLVRLRGVFAVMATLAFVLVIQTGINNWEPVTGGSQGLSGIPLVMTTGILSVILIAVVLLFVLLDLGPIGTRLDSTREDEGAAVSQGISIESTHLIALVFSGALAGLVGVCLAFNSYAIYPTNFDFALATQAVTFVFLGGFRSWRGPVIGAFVVTLLPEVFRPLDEQRLLLNGAILILVMVLLPKGVVDTTEAHIRALRRGRRSSLAESELNR